MKHILPHLLFSSRGGGQKFFHLRADDKKMGKDKNYLENRNNTKAKIPHTGGF